MLCLISPAKSLAKMEITLAAAKSTPVLLPQADELAEAMKPLKKADYKKLMSLSDSLANGCVEMFQNYVPCNNDGACAGGLFDGPAYKGLDCKSLNEIEMQRCQERVRFLSGLYGLLRPCDIIQNHRLEMGTKGLPLPGNCESLYDYWGHHVAKSINEHFDAASSSSTTPGLLLNCASEEYFKVVDRSLLDGDKIKIVNCIFQDNGKVVSVYAKRARGLMSRFVSTDDNVHKAVKEKDFHKIMKALTMFDLESYKYSEKQSDDSTLVFNRTKPPSKGTNNAKEDEMSKNIIGNKRKKL